MAQRTQGFCRNAVDVTPEAAGDFKGKRLDQQRDIVRTLAQRRQMDRKDVQTIVEIAAELAIGDHLPEIAVGGGDQPDIGADQLVAAETFKLLFLQNPQQLRLQLQRHVAHFIEK